MIPVSPPPRTPTRRTAPASPATPDRPSTRRRPRRAATVAAALALVAGVAACSDDEAGGPGPTTTVDVEVAEPGSGVLLGDDPRAQQVVDVVEEALVELDLQSVVFGVWEGDREVARGAIDAPAAIPATSPDALVRVGQPMEPMLGTVLLQLGVEGVVDLDEPVARWLPDLVNGDRITPRMLTNSTSGTPDFVPNPAFETAVYADPFHEWTTPELLAYAQQSPPLFEPGTSWAYSHTDLALLGTVLEEATGQTLADLLEERVFEPVGMASASVHTTNEIGTPTFRAYTNERGVYEESTTWNPTWALNSGNMNASVPDIGRWLRALARGDVLSEAAHTEMFAPNTSGLGPMTDERYFSFGMIVSDGWVLGNPSLQGYAGFAAQLLDPEITIVVYSTGTRANDGADNDSITIGTRLSEVVSPDHPAPAPRR